MSTGHTGAPLTSCVVVAICGAAALNRCLAGIGRLDTLPDEIIVVSSDRFAMPEALALRATRVVRIASDSPVDLAAAGISAARGEKIFLLEDHCVPDVGWLDSLTAATSAGGVTAAGGPIDAPLDSRGFDWAFFIVDFFRYLPPLATGQARSLSVCNVAYTRKNLDAIRAEWEHGFHETRVHSRLAGRGSLVVASGARVTSYRRVRTRDGIRERFTFGWLFAATRFRRNDATRRILHASGAPVLPVVLLARIAVRCSRERAFLRRLVGAFPHVVALLTAWSLGELVGYAIGKPPASSPAAPDR